VWPVIAGYLIAITVKPLVCFLNSKIKLREIWAISICLTVFIILIFLVGYFLGRGFVIQTKNLVSNWERISSEVENEVLDICWSIEDGMKLERGVVFTTLEKSIDAGVEEGKAKIMSLLMDNSVSAIVKAAEAFVGIIVAVVSAFLFLKGREEIKAKFSRFPFSQELKRVIEKAKFIFKAYIKAQLVIMLVSMVLCFVGLTIIGNPYSLILAVVIGILDALPFIGGGVILVPWGIYFIISNELKNGIVLLFTFVICYILREVLEPRLVGDKIGISPLLSLATMYAGFKLVGIIGAVLGPLAVVVVRECLRCDIGKEETKKEEGQKV